MQKCFLIVIWFACYSASADIVQPDRDLSYWIGEALGQSFTATASEAHVRVVSFLTGDAINLDFADPTITLQVRNGIGFAGAVLGSQTVPSIPKSTPPGTWIDFVFDSPLALTPGQTYTLRFTATNVENTVISALSYGASNGNPYSGGTIIVDLTPSAQRDLAFRVLSVLEPTSYALCMIMGATLILSRRRSQPDNNSPSAHS